MTPSQLWDRWLFYARARLSDWQTSLDSLSMHRISESNTSFSSIGCGSMFSKNLSMNNHFLLVLHSFPFIYWPLFFPLFNTERLLNPGEGEDYQGMAPAFLHDMTESAKVSTAALYLRCLGEPMIAPLSRQKPSPTLIGIVGTWNTNTFLIFCLALFYLFASQPFAGWSEVSLLW